MNLKQVASVERDSVEVCLNLPVRGLRLVLAATVGSLFLAHLVTQYFSHFHPLDSSLFRMLVTAFDLNAESNLATWYASSSLLLCSLLFTIIWLSKRRTATEFYWHWFGLAALALVFSADEIACMHEKLNAPLRSWLGVGGFFRFAWVIPGLAFLVLVLLSYRRFYASLPSSTRRRFGLSIAVFFIGSLGFEMLGGKWSELHGRSNFGYGVLTGGEELFEMVGVLLLIDCLALYIRSQVVWFTQPVVSRKTNRARVA